MHPLAETALALWQRQPFEERILLLSQREDVLKTLLRHQARLGADPTAAPDDLATLERLIEWADRRLGNRPEAEEQERLERRRAQTRERVRRWRAARQGAPPDHRLASKTAARVRHTPARGSGGVGGQERAAVMRRSSCQRSIKRSMACRRDGISPCVFAHPGRPASIGSVTLHSHGFGSRELNWPCRIRPMTRPSNTATPSVPGSLSGKVRCQEMSGSLILFWKGGR